MDPYLEQQQRDQAAKHKAREEQKRADWRASWRAQETAKRLGSLVVEQRLHCGTCAAGQSFTFEAVGFLPLASAHGLAVTVEPGYSPERNEAGWDLKPHGGLRLVIASCRVCGALTSFSAARLEPTETDSEAAQNLLDYEISEELAAGARARKLIDGPPVETLKEKLAKATSAAERNEIYLAHAIELAAKRAPRAPPAKPEAPAEPPRPPKPAPRAEVTEDDLARGRALQRARENEDRLRAGLEPL